MSKLQFAGNNCMSPSVTINRNGHLVHRLIDDTMSAVRASRKPIRRDPMVAALFGEAPECADAGGADTPTRQRKRQ